jgi:uncharacterized damage-inducible protein DinB
MPENRDELIAHYAATRADLLDALEGLSDETMSERTLDGWSISDHLAHIAAWDEVRAAEVARISAGWTSAWRMTHEQDEAYNALSYALRADLTAAQARWELATTRERLLSAIAAATARGLDGSLYGEAGLRSTHEVEHGEWIRRWRGERGI